MEKREIKSFVAEQLSKGLSLSDIQKLLSSEKGVTMTFLDLRVLASELENVDWSKQNKEEAPKGKITSAPQDADEEGMTDEEEPFSEDDADALPGAGDAESAAGGTVVEVNKIARPGAMLSGSVRFGSGASADWLLDSMGRVGLEKAQGKPTQKDIEEFQTELHRLLSRHS